MLMPHGPEPWLRVMENVELKSPLAVDGEVLREGEDFLVVAPPTRAAPTLAEVLGPVVEAVERPARGY